MKDFTYYNPVRIEFGKGAIGRVSSLAGNYRNIMITYGGGSIKKNGVYDQVHDALKENTITEFGGIEPNPDYDTLMKAVQLCRKRPVDLLLAVGGGSVLDGTKFIAAAIYHSGDDSWEIVSRGAPVEKTIPLGCILTLPATGSEMNSIAVISKRSSEEKRAFSHPGLFPDFTVIDPETTYSLPPVQIANGIIDTFAHVVEQYLTVDVNTPLQDRQAEAILLTLIEEGPKALHDPTNYDVRANLCWCATQALNGLIGCGTVSDWASHGIGHELTALYGISHGHSLAVVFPAVMEFQKPLKREKLLQYAERVWNISGEPDSAVERAIMKTREFFQSLGVGTKLSDHGIAGDAPEKVGSRLEAAGVYLGEHRNLGGREVKELLKSVC